MFYDVKSITTAPTKLTGSSWGADLYLNATKDTYIYYVDEDLSKNVLYKLVYWYTTDNTNYKGLYCNINSTLKSGDVIGAGSDVYDINLSTTITITANKRTSSTQTKEEEEDTSNPEGSEGSTPIEEDTSNPEGSEESTPT